ncbi:MAG: multidrug ABC transporter [Lachnospiraceae bacterium]|nr:multidrug ABC transporter [Lachnospiraceae bacterium]
MNTDFLTPQVCYAAAILGAFVTALSQILLKRQANITEAGKKGFLQKFLNIRVFLSYGMLFMTLVINQIALIHVPISVMPCITATSFIWVFVLGIIILGEKVSRRRVLGVAIIIAGVIISRL